MPENVKLPLFESLTDILAKVNTRRIAKEQTTQLPPLDVNVQQLCHLVWNTWQNQYDYIGKTVTSYEKHSHFIEAARRCCQPALDQQRQRNQVQSRIYSQTLSSKAKRQQKNQLFHSQLDAEPAHKLEPTRAKAAKPVVVSEEEQLRIAIQKSRRSSMVKLSTDQERNVDKIVDLLSIPPIHRSPSSIKKSFMLVRSIPAFSKLSNFVLTQLCAVMALNLTPSGQIVFRQGEEGTCWYVILQGTVEIWIALPGLLVYTPGSEIYLEPDQIKQRSKMVAILGQGYGFGELAIMNDSLRAATIITSSDCILLKVEKRNYNQIVRSIYEQESRNKISFLKKIPIIGNAIDIKNLADKMIVKTFEADSVILKEGDAIQSLYLMKEGTCQVTKRIVTTSPKTGQAKVATVHIGAYNAEDYFGEESLLYHFEHNEVETLSLPSTVTVTAVNGPVHVGVMTLHDALRYIPKELTRSSLTTLFQNPESLLEKYRSDEEQKRWSAMKSRMMDAIVKEKFHDPNMSRAKYHAAISHPQTPFKF